MFIASRRVLRGARRVLYSSKQPGKSTEKEVVLALLIIYIIIMGRLVLTPPLLPPSIDRSFVPVSW